MNVNNDVYIYRDLQKSRTIDYKNIHQTVYVAIYVNGKIKRTSELVKFSQSCVKTQ